MNNPEFTFLATAGLVMLATISIILFSMYYGKYKKIIKKDQKINETVKPTSKDIRYSEKPSVLMKEDVGKFARWKIKTLQGEQLTRIGYIELISETLDIETYREIK